MSLNKVYDIGFNHALKVIERNGGKLEGNNISIVLQTPKAVRFEQNFVGMYPVTKQSFRNAGFKSLDFEFEGTGFILRGEARKKNQNVSDYVFVADLFIDGEKLETAKLPTSFTTRRHELFWKFSLPEKKHLIHIEVLNPDNNYELNSWGYIIYKSSRN